MMIKSHIDFEFGEGIVGKSNILSCFVVGKPRSE